MKKLISILALAVIACPAHVCGATSIVAAAVPPTATLSSAIEITVSLDLPASENAPVEIVFSDQMRVPEEIKGGQITVSDMPVTNPKVEGPAVSFTLPEPQDDRQNLKIVIPQSCGVKNPFKAGFYQIKLQIGADEYNAPLEITRLMTEAPQVVIRPDKVGYQVGITIQMPHPEALQVASGDALTIVFPQEFILPDRVDPEFVSLSGKPIAAGSIGTGLLKLVYSSDVAKDVPLSVVLSPQFGIKSPLWPGEFTLKIAILGKMEETESAVFQVLPLSSTLSVAVEPPLPEDEWFSEKPEIQISSKAKREIYYFWDMAQKRFYEAPIIAPDGVHVLGVVGKAPSGGWESVKYRTFKVDIDPPVFASLTTMTNKEELELVYRVIDSSPCTSGIGNTEAALVSDNRFKVTLNLVMGPNDFVFWAKDSAGRQVEIKHTIILDQTPPALKITRPKPLSTACGKLIQVEGKTEPDCVVTINGINATINTNGEFLANIQPQNEGPLDINVASMDPAGNIAQKSVPVFYVESAKISFEAGTRSALFLGAPRDLETEAYEKEGAIFAPLPLIADALGYAIQGDAFTLTDKFGARTVEFKVGSTKITVKDGGVFESSLDAAPEVSNGTICVPSKFFEVGLGLKVQIEEKKVTIYFCPRG